METVAILSGVVALVFVYQTLHQDQLTNRVAARQAIAGQYREIEAREFEHPDLYLQLFSADFSRSAPAFVDHALHVAAPSLTSTVASPKDLDDLLWHSDDTSELTNADRSTLRSLFLHGQAYLNFLDEVVKSRANGVISTAEADTWLNILDYEEFYCNPVVLYVMWDAARSSLYSVGLAQEIQDRLEGHAQCQPIIDYFYKDLKDGDKWAEQFLHEST